MSKLRVPMTLVWRAPVLALLAPLFLLLSRQVPGVQAQQVILYRINAGGPEIAATDGGPNWSEDRVQPPGFVGGDATLGVTSPYNNAKIAGNNAYGALEPIAFDASIPAGMPEAIFQMERWDPNPPATELEWDFPVAAITTVEVRFYFAEIYTPTMGVGDRIFDIAIEGVVPPQFDDLDIYALAGNTPYYAFMLSYVLDVADGNLDIDFLHEVQHPAIKAIEIVAINETAASLLSVSPSALVFDRESVGQGLLPQSVTVKHIGVGISDDITISAATLLGSGAGAFTHDLEVPQTLAPGEGIDVRVTMPPGTTGVFTATLEFVHSGDNSPLIVDLSGEGVANPDEVEVLYRVNVGGPELAAADSSAPNWSADSDANPSPYRQGGFNIYDAAAPGAHPGPIIMTDPSLPPSAPSTLFTLARWDDGAGGDPIAQEMRWAFPVIPGRLVHVRLFFAELDGTVTGPGQRVFDVRVEDVVPQAFFAIDLFAVGGAKGAFMLETTLFVQDGMVDLAFLHDSGNPMVQGIEVRDGQPIPVAIGLQQVKTKAAPGPWPAAVSGWIFLGVLTGWVGRRRRAKR